MFTSASSRFLAKRAQWHSQRLARQTPVRDDGPSTVPITAIIPVAPKDTAFLPFVIEGALTNIQHPVAEILVVSRDSTVLNGLPGDVRFVHELDVIPTSLHKWRYQDIRGSDRTGWIWQQTIKLACDQVADTETILAIDADTTFTSPVRFSNNEGAPILYCSDEYHAPYGAANRSFIGLERRAPVSFVSHHMAFEKSVLRQIRERAAEIHQMPWEQALVRSIDKTSQSGFSEYEAYGNYVMYRGQRGAEMRYWWNERLESMPPSFSDLSSRFRGRRYSVSLHQYQAS